VPSCKATSLKQHWEGTSPKRRAEARIAVQAGCCDFWLDVLALSGQQRHRVEDLLWDLAS
jgi:hypothetical protein